MRPTAMPAMMKMKPKTVAKRLPPLANRVGWRAGVIDGALPQPAVSPTLFARTGNILPVALGFLLIMAGIAVARSRRYSATAI